MEAAITGANALWVLQMWTWEILARNAVKEYVMM
jgi:hypothetical protein